MEVRKAKQALIGCIYRVILKKLCYDWMFEIVDLNWRENFILAAMKRQGNLFGFLGLKEAEKRSRKEQERE